MAPTGTKRKPPPRPKKVYTPGSTPQASRGRPKKTVAKKAGSARLGNYQHKYSQEALQQALEAIRDQKMNIKRAAITFGVPRTTLHDRLREKVTGDLGRPTVLCKEEESILVERLVLLGQWGFPLTKMDLRLLVKNYLDERGRETIFKNNMPGKDFVSSFLARHPQLTIRTASLIKRSRAAVGHDVVNEFFNHFEQTVDGIPPENCFNYDETNLRKEPYFKKINYFHCFQFYR